ESCLGAPGRPPRPDDGQGQLITWLNVALHVEQRRRVADVLEQRRVGPGFYGHQYRAGPLDPIELAVQVEAPPSRCQAFDALRVKSSGEKLRARRAPRRLCRPELGKQASKSRRADVRDEVETQLVRKVGDHRAASGIRTNILAQTGR